MDHTNIPGTICWHLKFWVHLIVPTPVSPSPIPNTVHHPPTPLSISASHIFVKHTRCASILASFWSELTYVSQDIPLAHPKVDLPRGCIPDTRYNIWYPQPQSTLICWLFWLDGRMSAKLVYTNELIPPLPYPLPHPHPPLPSPPSHLGRFQNS